jgi:hypothetical protein
MSKSTIDISELQVRLTFLTESLAHINQLSYQQVLSHVNTEDLNKIARVAGVINIHTQEILDRQKERMKND